MVVEDPAVEAPAAVVEAADQEDQVVVEAAVALPDPQPLGSNLVVRRYNLLTKVLISDLDRLL